MTIEGLCDPKEISRQATSSYRSALHHYESGKMVWPPPLYAIEGECRNHNCFDFDERLRCVGQRRHDYLTWLRHYTIQGVSMA